MKRRIGYTLFYIGWVAVARSQVRPPDLLPTARLVIEDQKFCEWNGLRKSNPLIDQFREHTDMIAMRVKIRAIFKNSGKKALILPLFPEASVSIARQTRKEAPFKAEKVWTVQQMSAEERDLLSRGVDLSEPSHPFFEVIPPGAEGEWALPFTVVIPVSRRLRGASGFPVVGQTVWIALEVDNRLSEGLARVLALQWQSIGALWSDQTPTDPVSLVIPQSPHVTNCTGDYRVD